MYAAFENYIVPRERYLFPPERHESVYDYLLACHRRIAKDLGDYTAYVTPTGDTCVATPMSALLRDVERLASFLAQKGLRTGDAVTAALPPCGQALTVLLAVNKLGAILHLLSPDAAPDALAAAAARTESKALFLYEQDADAACLCVRCGASDDSAAVTPFNDSGFSYRQVVLQALPAAKTAAGNGKADAICLPGGRQGRTVVLSSFALNTQIYQYYLMDMPHDTRKDHALAALPCHSGFGLTAMLYALCAAYKPVMVPSFDAVRVNDLIRRLRIIEIFGDAALFSALLEAPNFEHEGLRRLRLLFVCGEIDDALAHRFDETVAIHGSVARLCRCWGPAEMTGAAVSSCWQHYHVRAAGFPLGGVTVQIWDDACRELPDGESGEIVLAGDTMMNGYLSDEAVHENGFYLDETGGRWIRSGRTGRLEGGYLMLETAGT